tara:strand:- start:3109 stop:4014 length:906 start_codon:yes stop_codon:yes gene_type:complete
MIKNYNHLIKLFKKNVNIQNYLKRNTTLKKYEITKIAYDIQSGSYIDFHYKVKNKLPKILDPVIKEIKKFKNIKTILDFGTGELTNLSYIMNNLPSNIKFYANDISLSRLILGKKFIKKKISNKKFKNLNIFCTNHFKLPFKDNSIDLIITIQAIEPNNAYKKDLLNELIRVSKKGLVLMEPHFEIGDQKSKKRMKKFGYIRNFEKLIKSYKIPYSIIKKEHHFYSLNPNSIFVMKKNKKKSNISYRNFVDPVYKDKLKLLNNYYYSDKSKRIYPLIDDIVVFSDDININLINNKLPGYML